MTDRFLCPKSGEPCQFYNMCASRKEEVSDGIHRESPLAAFVQILTYQDPRLAEAETVSYCVNERMEAFAAINESPEGSFETRQAAVNRLIQMDFVRNQFRGEGPTEAEAA